MTNEEKMKTFIMNLMRGPIFANDTIGHIERQIVQFLTANQDKIRLMLTSDDFFPNMEWKDILKLFLTTLKDIATSILLTRANNILLSMKFDFLVFFGNKDDEYYKKATIDFLKFIMTFREGRIGLDISLNLIEAKFNERYVAEAFNRRQRMYNELVRIGRINMNPDEYSEFLNLCLLLKNALYIKLPIPNSIKPSQPVSYYDVMVQEEDKKNYLNTIDGVMREKLSGFAQRIINTAIRSNFRSENTENEDSPARYLYIAYARGRDYKKNIKVDRGADTPDKSWFGIARKNYKQFGFDINLLDEFYKIAADMNY